MPLPCFRTRSAAGPTAPRTPHALRLALLSAAVGAAASAAAEDRAPAPALQDEVITVIGTRTERALDQIDATITVLDREAIDRQISRDLRDLVRYEPGVSVGGSGSRFGLDGFTIRGVGGNRVLTVVDGVRIAEEFSFGPFLSARRDFVDVDSLERLEIARGPISTLYGSDALGGVVALTTLGPFDYVDEGKPWAVNARTGYSTEDEALFGGVTTAVGNERFAAMLSYTYRDAQQMETGGSVGGTGPDRERADPQELDQEDLRVRLAWRPVDGHEVTFTSERFEGGSTTRILSDYGTRSRGTLIERRDADDVRDRERHALNWRFKGSGDGVLDHARILAYRQTSDTRQVTEEDRLPPGRAPQFRTRDSRFQQEITGTQLQFGRGFDMAGMRHELLVGGEWYRTENASLRDGGTVDAATGTPLPEFNPLPTRDFPLTQVTHRALFLQDEILLLDDRLRLTPGLRWDDFEAEATADEIYLSGNPGSATPEDYQDDQVTLRFGAVYEFTDGLSAWGRYSEGFRAPPYDDVNVGFTNFIGGYKSIAAPNLESETSEGFEVGLRADRGWGSVQAAVFRTRFDNFIASFLPAERFAATGGIDPADGLLTFQSTNLDEVTIEGWELRGTFPLAGLNPGLRLETALAYARGEDEATGDPVDTVEPLNGVVGLRWSSASGRFDSQLIATWSVGKDAEDIATDRPATDAWVTLDWLVQARITQNIRVDAGLFNLTDETYVRWVDTAGVGTDALLRFSQPGRHAGVNLRVTL